MKPWLCTVIGSFLILGSSAISGVYVSILESESIDDARMINQKKTQYDSSKEDYNNALIRADLSYINRSIVRYGVYQQNDVQKEWNGVHAFSLYAVILQLRSASDMPIDDMSISEIKKLRDQSNSSDDDSYQKLQKMASELMGISGHYRAKLVMDIAGLEYQRSKNEQKISNVKYIAIFLQLLGLIFLLVKEFSINPRKNKSDMTTCE
ncbi:hypothetical protein [Aeromonas enteropelogenes]|uniref:hypothetical protein n=1 Tax=Aeromonas enteropelogenes TaxID=29489 RepID=UPI003988CF3F